MAGRFFTPEPPGKPGACTVGANNNNKIQSVKTQLLLLSCCSKSRGLHCDLCTQHPGHLSHSFGPARQPALTPAPPREQAGAPVARSPLAGAAGCVWIKPRLNFSSGLLAISIKDSENPDSPVWDVLYAPLLALAFLKKTFGLFSACKASLESPTGVSEPVTKRQ